VALGIQNAVCPISVDARKNEAIPVRSLQSSFGPPAEHRSRKNEDGVVDEAEFWVEHFPFRLLFQGWDWDRLRLTATHGPSKVIT
jgi:hypothetical protein